MKPIYLYLGVGALLIGAAVVALIFALHDPDGGGIATIAPEPGADPEDPADPGISEGTEDLPPGAFEPLPDNPDPGEDGESPAQPDPRWAELSVPELLDALEDARAVERVAICNQLAITGNRQALGRLERLILTDNARDVRIAAVRALAAIQGQGCASTLVPYLDHHDEATRGEVLRVIREFPDTGVLHLLTTKLRDASYEPRYLLIAAVAATPTTQAANALQRVVLDEQEAMQNRQHALAQLGSMRDAEGQPGEIARRTISVMAEADVQELSEIARRLQ